MSDGNDGHCSCAFKSFAHKFLLSAPRSDFFKHDRFDSIWRNEYRNLFSSLADNWFPWYLNIDDFIRVQIDCFAKSLTYLRCYNYCLDYYPMLFQSNIIECLNEFSVQVFIWPEWKLLQFRNISCSTIIFPYEFSNRRKKTLFEAKKLQKVNRHTLNEESIVYIRKKTKRK